MPSSDPATSSSSTRHHALRADSSIADVASTASNRARADQARSRAGLVSESLRQRSKVCTATPSSRASSATGALSGGSIRATARSLKACPYRAIFVPHHRPRIIGSYRGDNNSDAGGSAQAWRVRFATATLPRIRDPVLSRSTCLDCLQTKRVDCREDMCGPPCGAVSEFIRFREAEAKGVC